MPVNNEHPDYDSFSLRWRKCRVTVEGEDAVKNAGTAFLPALSGQSDEEYKAYNNRASFYNASGRTVDGIAGAVFRKDPETQFPDDKFLDNVGKGGQPFITFAKKTFKEVLTLGRYGVLLDTDEYTDINTYPYFVGYTAENIVNWDYEVVDGRERPTMVVLREVVLEQDPADKFVWKEAVYYRELQLSTIVPSIAIAESGKGTVEVEQFESPVYFVTLWREKEGKGKGDKDKYEIVSITTPTIRGTRLEYIPFVFFGPTDLSVSPEKPPILDIVNVNLSHYRSSADLEHGRHFTALPTPWAAGFKVDKGGELRIGSSSAWVADDPQANAGYLEFSGEGLKALSEALEQKEAHMAILGARLLEEPKRAVEATDTHKMRRSGEEGITASLAITVSRGFHTLFTWAAQWMVKPDRDIQVQLNTDFVAIEIDPAMMTGLLTLLQQAKISYSTFFYNLQRGEVIPEGRTMEDEMELIEKEGPLLTTMRTIEEDATGGEDEEDPDIEEEEEEDDDSTASAA